MPTPGGCASVWGCPGPPPAWPEGMGFGNGPPECDHPDHISGEPWAGEREQPEASGEQDSVQVSLDSVSLLLPGCGSVSVWSWARRAAPPVPSSPPWGDIPAQAQSRGHLRFQ